MSLCHWFAISIFDQTIIPNNYSASLLNQQWNSFSHAHICTINLIICLAQMFCPFPKCFQFSFKLYPYFYSWDHPQLSAQCCSDTCQSQWRITSSQRFSCPIPILLLNYSRPCSRAIQDHAILSLFYEILVTQSFHEIPSGNVPLTLLRVPGFFECRGVPGANYKAPHSLTCLQAKHRMRESEADTPQANTL